MKERPLYSSSFFYSLASSSRFALERVKFELKQKDSEDCSIEFHVFRQIIKITSSESLSQGAATLNNEVYCFYEYCLVPRLMSMSRVTRREGNPVPTDVRGPGQTIVFGGRAVLHIRNPAVLHVQVSCRPMLMSSSKLEQP